MRTKTRAINVKMLHAQLQLRKKMDFNFIFGIKLMSKQPNIFDESISSFTLEKLFSIE